jgi:hypothetical protein
MLQSRRSGKEAFHSGLLKVLEAMEEMEEMEEMEGMVEGKDQACHSQLDKMVAS